MSIFFPVTYESGLIDKSYTDLIHTSIKTSHRILFSVASVSNNFLALGTQTGVIYLFSLADGIFKYWSSIFFNESSILKIQFSPKSHIAYYNKKNQILIYKLSLEIDESLRLVRQVDNFSVNLVQLMLWDEESFKLYYSGINGTVDVVHIPHQTKDYFHGPTEHLVKINNQSIVQIDVCRDVLLISTQEKVVLFNTNSKTTLYIGSKPRSGPYGACFWELNVDNVKVLAARPNYRIWIASLDGTVEETHQYKNWTNSPIYKIKDSGDCSEGSGQFYFLSHLRDNLVLAGEKYGLVLLLNLEIRRCVVTINCGKGSINMSPGLGFSVLTNQREVNFLSYMSIKDALYELLKCGDDKVAVDLFLSLQIDQNETDDEVNRLRMVYNTLPPDILTKLVERSALLEYSFSEANNLQVIIRDNQEYQRIFCTSDSSSIRSSEQVLSVDLLDSTSTSMDNSHEIDKTSKKSKKKAANKSGGTLILKTLYDKTSSFLSHMDIISSSNSDLLPGGDLYPSVTDDCITIEDSMEPKTDVVELQPPQINTMELEANVYIASEKLKHLKNNPTDTTKSNFHDSLVNFCECWLRLTIEYRCLLREYEVHIRNLSATFPRLSVSTNSSIYSESNSSFDVNFLSTLHSANQITPLSNSWSLTVKPADWLKELPVPTKLVDLIGDLLSLSCKEAVFRYFPDLIAKIEYCSMDILEGENEEIVLEVEDDWIDLHPPDEDDYTVDFNQFEEKLNQLVTKSHSDKLLQLWEEYVAAVGYFDSLPGNLQNELSLSLIQYFDDLGGNFNEVESVDNSTKETEIVEDVDKLEGFLLECIEKVREANVAVDHPVLLRGTTNKLVSVNPKDKTKCYSDMTPLFSPNNCNSNIDLYEILNKQIWLKDTEIEYGWLDAILCNFGFKFNLNLIREWLVSGISHWVWSKIMFHYGNLFTYVRSKPMYNDLEGKSTKELENLLFTCLSLDGLEPLIIANNIFSVIKERNWSWKPVVEADNLELRNALHFSLRYGLDFSGYLLALFSHQPQSLKFVTRNHLMEHIYELPDVLMVAMYSIFEQFRNSVSGVYKCKCGAILSLNRITLPQVYHKLALEIIRHGTLNGYYETHKSMLQNMLDLCADLGFSEGYIELILSNSDVKQLIEIAFQLQSYEILERIKDLNLSSSMAISDALQHIVDKKRIYRSNVCLQCGSSIDTLPSSTTNSTVESGLSAITWDDIGKLVFVDLCNNKYNRKLVLTAAMEIFNENEVVYTKKYLSGLIMLILNDENRLHEPGAANYVNESLSCDKSKYYNQLSKFIQLESSILSSTLSDKVRHSGDAELTEKYLDLYSLGRVRLCGSNWGRILSRGTTTVCNLCGRQALLTETVIPQTSQVTASSPVITEAIIVFPCGHCFHTTCLETFSFKDMCVLCGYTS